ncbi:3-oxo-tetronate kinase [Vibrio sp. MA40-2]|uniref:3-oxo-tetronate kinase n=1 Tax=Vibrio sp. MA40-2 TaxID=3391828 RepID=UPI0039A6C231
MLLGVIADDFTGATDIAGFLVANGMRTIQLNGVPENDIEVDADAVVISLKSRSCPVNEAVESSLTAMDWLRSRGCQQYYFKYCSTFDSTTEGNIGPVTDALLNGLGEEFTIVCPALPVNGRTVFNGHLFVLGELLCDSGMRNHPVTPMLDSSLVRLMDAQSEGNTGLVNYQTIEEGADYVIRAFDHQKSEGKRYAVVDAFNASHLNILGEAVKSLKLVTGGSGLAAGIAKNWESQLSDQTEALEAGRPVKANTVVLSGSCSVRTNEQVAAYMAKAPSIALDVQSCIEKDDYVSDIAKWVMDNLNGELAPLVYATAESKVLKLIQQTYGADTSSKAVEQFFSQLAHQLREQGINNFIVAGGETSGVVTQSLAVEGFHIGPQITPGVPWVKAIDSSLSLALKSGNFGELDFFSKAQEFYHE